VSGRNVADGRQKDVWVTVLQRCRKVFGDDLVVIEVGTWVKVPDLYAHGRALFNFLDNQLGAGNVFGLGGSLATAKQAKDDSLTRMKAEATKESFGLMYESKMRSQPRRAASIAAMSIFFICIIASNARLAAARSGSVIAFVRAIGVICQDNPHLSLHHPHALSWPP
jgi:hypothetical protein